MPTSNGSAASSPAGSPAASGGEDVDVAPVVRFADPDELLQAVGRQLGPTPWLQITQERVDQFAEATGDHQWIHVDVERARSGPFGGTIAHGYLTLSLSNALLPQMVQVEGISLGVNYGTEKVRFPSPVLVGSKIRARGEIASAVEIQGGVQTVIRITIEQENSAKPACVVEAVSRYLR